MASLLGHAALTAVVVATLAEITLRLLWGSPRSWREDPELGRMPRPHGAYYQAVDGRATAHYNGLGLRYPVDLGPRAAGERRLLVMGDSLTEAVEVADGETFTALLDEGLRADRPARAINAGRMAWLAGDLLHGASVLRDRVDADALLVVVRAGTFSLNPAPDVLLPGFWTARYRLRPDGGVALERLRGLADISARAPAWLLRLKQESALLDAGFSRLTEIAASFRPAVSAPIEEALLRRRIGFFVGELARDWPGRAAIGFVLQDDLIAGRVDAREALAESLVETACQRNRLPFASTREPFRRLYVEDHVLPVGFANNSRPGAGHLNQRGHRAFAAALLPIAQTLTR